MPVALIASRRSRFIESKDWLCWTKSRIVVLCCLKRSVHCIVLELLAGYNIQESVLSRKNFRGVMHTMMIAVED